MARSIRGRRRLSSHYFRSTPYPLPSYRRGAVEKESDLKKPSKALEMKDWENATCSVCMEFPHSAVLLLCSSYDKGCRPYMCGTSYRHSNCLDQFKKAYTRVLSPLNQDLGSGIPSWLPGEKSEVAELSCPLCRGQVKGWTVVEPARDFLNAKKRSCVQDNCSFVGNYKELRKHVRAEHPSVRPREVDPAHEQKWRRLEDERDRDDVISTIMSSMPGSMVWGDYVIEGNNSGLDTDEEGGFDGDGDYEIRSINDNFFYFLLHTIGNSGGGSFTSRLRRAQRGHRAFESNWDVGGRFPLMASNASDVAVSGASEGDGEDGPVIRRGRVGGRSGRRRRRSRGRAGVDMT